jgi:hypothetical protein
MLRHEWLPLRNFSASEKAALLVVNGIQNCGLNHAIVDRLATASINPPPLNPELPYLRPVKAHFNSITIPELEVPEVLPVVLELKKLPFQISPTLIVNTLATALEYLSATLTSDGSAVGADEIFQFFVYSLAAAKLRCLHGLTIVIEKFVHHSLRQTKANYLITQFVSGFEFIDNRMLPVQPYLLFPFVTLPPRLRGILTPLDNPSIVITGFAVFAFPCWSAERTDLFPALLRYTGEETDLAVCQQFETENPGALTQLLPDDIMRSNAVETSPTPHGTFFAVTPELIEKAWMIKVDGGNFEESISAVDSMSVLMLMAPTRIDAPSTAMMTRLFDALREYWRLRGNNGIEGVQSLVAEIQHGLVLMGKTDESGSVTGMMDRKTLISLQRVFCGNGGTFRFTMEIVEYIRKQVLLSRKMRK